MTFLHSVYTEELRQSVWGKNEKKNICYNNSVGGRVENRKNYSDHNSVTWRIWPLGVHGYFTIAIMPWDHRPRTKHVRVRGPAHGIPHHPYTIVLLLSASLQYHNSQAKKYSTTDTRDRFRFEPSIPFAMVG